MPAQLSPSERQLVLATVGIEMEPDWDVRTCHYAMYAGKKKLFSAASRESFKALTLEAVQLRKGQHGRIS